MISPLHMQAIAEVSSARIVDCLIEGTLIALCAALALRRQQNSGTRFAVWFSALMAIAAMPFLAGVFSGISSLRAAALPPSIHHSAITLPASWALYLFAAWAIIATLSLSRVAISLRHIRALRKSCVEIDATEIDPLLRQTLTAHGVREMRVPHPSRFSKGGNNGRRRISLCTSEKVQVPTAVGFFRPAVVIPAWLLGELSPEELNQILLHELAHLRRRDDWTNLAQQIVKALIFFHPAVWWIEKKISLEREMACDDAVLAATAQPRAYAECLAHLAEKTFIRRTLIGRGIGKGISLAQAALGRMRHTTLRVAEILNPNRERAARPTWKPALALIAAFALGSVILASHEPQLIAFQDSSAQQAIATNAVCGNGHVGTAALGCPAEQSSTVFSTDAPMLKPIPASFIAPQIQKTDKAFPLQHRCAGQRLAPQQKTLNAAATASRIQQTNFQPTNFVEANLDSANAQIFAFIVESEFNPPVPTANIHPASFATDSAISTQTIFVITQDPAADAAGQSLFQIHFWRVTVFHPATTSKPIPNKET
jgi:Zn-dependent protease with chaperone function